LSSLKNEAANYRYLLQEDKVFNLARIGKNLRQRIAERAQYRCGYCLAREDLLGDFLQVEHILPKSLGGTNDEENLCLACAMCNDAKWAKTHAHDPISNTYVALFNPNKQKWSEHFCWGSDGSIMIGLTSCGRATIAVLHLNHPHRVRVRKFWIKLNEHPPQT